MRYVCPKHFPPCATHQTSILYLPAPRSMFPRALEGGDRLLYAAWCGELGLKGTVRPLHSARWVRRAGGRCALGKYTCAQRASFNTLSAPYPALAAVCVSCAWQSRKGEQQGWKGAQCTAFWTHVRHQRAAAVRPSPAVAASSAADVLGYTRWTTSKWQRASHMLPSTCTYYVNPHARCRPHARIVLTHTLPICRAPLVHPSQFCISWCAPVSSVV